MLLYILIKINIEIIHTIGTLGINIDNADITDIVQAIVSVINLLLVIGFYKSDKKERKDEEKKTNFMYWYKEFVLESNIQNIIDFKTKLKNKIDNNMKIDDEQFAEYNKEFIKLKNDLTQILKIISKEKAKEIRETFSNFQDNFNLLIENEDSDIYEKKELVDKFADSLFKILYNYEEFNSQ